jgi:hypothetical protein
MHFLDIRLLGIAVQKEVRPGSAALEFIAILAGPLASAAH